MPSAAPDLIWPLTGRDELFRRVDGLVRSGRGVVLVGPAGVGKTRLATEVAASAAGRGSMLVRATASTSTARIPFGAVATLLPERRSARGPVADLAGAALRTLADRTHEHGPVVLVADDAQLLDDGSAAVIHQACVAGSATLIATVRSGEPVLGPVAALWKDDIVERVEVTALDESSVLALLAATLDGPVDAATNDELWRATEGNALYLRELVLASLEAGTLVRGERGWRLLRPPVGSARLRDLLEGRLAGATAGQRAVLELLAVGGRIGLEVVCRICEEADVEGVERQGLVVLHQDDRRRELALSHPLHAEILRNSIGRMTTMRLSRRLADELEHVGTRRRDDVLRSARWRLDGGGTPDVELLLLAADLAHGARDVALAHQLARAALDAGGGIEAVLELATAEAELGGAAEVERLLGSIARPPKPGESESIMAAGVMRRVSNLVWSLDRAGEASRLLDEATSWVTDPLVADELGAERAVLALFDGRPADALAIGLELEREGSPRARVRAALAVAPALLLAGRPGEALAVADRGFRAHLALEDQRGFGAAGTHVMFRIWALVELCRADEIRRWIDAVARQIAPTVDDAGRAWLAFCRGRAALRVGHLTIAAAEFAEAESRWAGLRQSGPARWALSGKTTATALSGDLVAAAAGADALERSGPPNDRSETTGMAVLEPEAASARAWAASTAGDQPAAVELLLTSARRAAANGDVLHCVESCHDAARLGGSSEALGVMADMPLDEWPLGAARRRHVAALADQDADALIAAGDELAELGVVIEAADALAAAAALCRRASRASAADRLAGRIGRLLVDADHASTPALAAMGAAALLSQREREVAMLASRDHSNRDIARQLHLSERTVENHLQRVFMKLAITSRKDLIDALQQR